MPIQRILHLGPADDRLADWLRAEGLDVISRSDRLDAATVRGLGADMILSNRYRHILRRDVLEAVPGPAVNLHIAMLPWNRGADPNLWSFVDDTPRGVTIHLMDEGVDTGDVIAQRSVDLDPAMETLATSYAALQSAIEALFHETWPAIRDGTFTAVPQSGPGSVHRVRDRERLAPLLSRGWDTPVSDLLGSGRSRA